MALGMILREAREQQGFSTAQVAEATHMMLQMVEEIEREDFHRIAAPIYGRGFVKLYAEFLNIDAEPLVKEFNDIFSGSRRPVVATRAVKSAAPAPAAVAPATPAAVAAVAASTAAATVSAGTGGAGGTAVSTADELDDLFGPPPPRPPAPVAPERHIPKRSAVTAQRSATLPFASRLPPPDSPATTRRPPLATRFSPLRALRALCGKKRVERSALSVERSAFLPRTLRRLDDALPNGWRSGPALAGAAAGLLVIGVIVVVALSSSSSSSSSIRQSSRQGLDGLPASDAPDTLVINTILPPPEPYVD